MKFNTLNLVCQEKSSPDFPGCFLYFLVHGGGIILTDIFCHLQHFHGNGAGAHGDFDPVDRLSTLRRANRILVVDGGRIVENGSPEELMALKGKYYKLVQIQSMTQSAEKMKEEERF